MIYLGIDLHRRFSYVVAIDSDGKVIIQQRIVHSKELWEQFFDHFKEPVQAVVESTLNWYFLVDWIESKVDKMVLANPFKVKAIASAQIKTDKIDAHMLAQLLRVNLIPECYISRRQERIHKNLIRHRVSLVRLRTQLKNKAHALLARNGIMNDIIYSDLFGKMGLRYLQSLNLSESEQWILQQQTLNIQHLNESIKEADNQCKVCLENNPTAQLLKTIPGIGQFLSLLLSSEIGDIHRFSHPKKLCCYAGLVPSVFASGDKIRMGRLIPQSNKWLRWGLIEAANIAHLHHQTFKRIFNRVRQRKGVNTAKVALARYMLTVIYHMLKNNQPFMDKFSVEHPLLGLALA